MSYLILDLETYPDPKLWQPGEKKARAKKDPADAFAPLFAHRVIAFGYALLDDNLVMQNLGCAGTAMYKDDERALLAAVSGFLNTTQATLVTFNGRGFDLPVLALRSLRHALPAAWYTAAHRKRYVEEHHLDLLDAFTESGAVQRSGFSLDTFCRIIGLPGKMGFDGSMVRGAFDRGEIAKIESYCTVDVVRTAFLLVRYLFLRGRIDRERFEEGTRGLWRKCEELQMQGVLFGADMNVLLGQPTAQTGEAA